MQRISHGRGPNHQRNNTKDKGGLWLWMPHSYDIHHVPIQPPKSSIKSTRPTMFNNQGGGDGSVYRTTGSRARAFTVRSNGIEYSGAMCFPPSSDAKPYYSELEANKGVQAIADEIEINCPPHGRAVESLVRCHGHENNLFSHSFFVFALTFCYHCCRWIYPHTPLVWKSLFLPCCWPAWSRWPVVPYTQNWSDLLPGSVRCRFSIHSDTDYRKWYNPRWYLVLGKCIHTCLWWGVMSMVWMAIINLI